jgi:uncharacterized membrane protein YdbT with pleckstrin-like domain
VNNEIDQKKFLTYIKRLLPIYWIPKLGQWWHKKYLSRLVYRLDDDCIVREHGVFLFSKEKVPYIGIREASVRRGLILQLFGGSIVSIQPAGRNQGYAEIEVGREE